MSKQVIIPSGDEAATIESQPLIIGSERKSNYSDVPPIPKEENEEDDDYDECDGDGDDFDELGLHAGSCLDGTIQLVHEVLLFGHITLRRVDDDGRLLDWQRRLESAQAVLKEGILRGGDWANLRVAMAAAAEAAAEAAAA